MVGCEQTHLFLPFHNVLQRAATWAPWKVDIYKLPQQLNAARPNAHKTHFSSLFCIEVFSDSLSKIVHHGVSKNILPSSELSRDEENWL